MTPPVWLISASSSGFGKFIALDALKRGHTVVATARSTAKIEDLKEAGATTIALDVTDSLDNLKKIIAGVIEKHGRIDHLINAAGYILEGAVEEATPEETIQQFNTNLFGNLNVIRAVLPYMREQKSGVIALFGSLGSWRAGPAFALYSATKWACSGVAEGLRPELEPFGITTFVIEPGYFRTGFLNPGARVKTQALPEYEVTAVGETRKLLDKTDNNQPGDVRKGAKVIVDVMTKTGSAEGKEIPLRLVLGTDVDGVIRDKASSTVKLLDEWHDVIVSTDHDQ
jgi:NAD(P)-dependent dehydrogenase (short-subunit alcohol dehydrogenase family)